MRRVRSGPDLRLLEVSSLRHTAALLLLKQGVAPRVVMELLGHSTIALNMNTYSHVMPQMLREAADELDRALGGASS